MKADTGTRVILSLFALVLLIAMTERAFCQPEQGARDTDANAKLVRAVMAESMDGLEPVNKAVLFSTELRRIICFTEFDPVTETEVIYHKWYQRGVLIATKQLTIKPPRWASFSSMQLRGTDIGPWQVDILDAQGRILHILRFSITE